MAFFSFYTGPSAPLASFLLLFRHLGSLYWKHLAAPQPYSTRLALTTNTTHYSHTYANTSTHSALSNSFFDHSSTQETFVFILMMEKNFSTPPSSTATTDPNNTNTTTMINIRQPNIACTQNSQLSFGSTISTALPHYFLPAAQYMQPFHESMQFHGGQPLATYPVYPVWYGQNSIEIGAAGNGVPAGSWLWPPSGVAKEQQTGCTDPHRTKMARIKRKLARQRSLSLQRNNAASGASSGLSSSTYTEGRRLTMYGADAINAKRDLYKFCTPDNKRLRMLLRKELKNSDVGSLGRIVLPKREAEENLPSLSDKEGIQVVMRDAYSDQVWSLKFKYWSNNKSRMYVLENTGDFVKQNGLEIGDSLTLYEDENKNLYFSITKVGKSSRSTAETSYKQHYNNTYNYIDTPVMHQDRDEEDASLQLLIEQLKHKEQQEAYNLMTLPMAIDGASSYRQHDQEANEGPCISPTNLIINSHMAEAAMQLPLLQSAGKSNVADDPQNNTTDDCYGGLDMLPDVNRYNFSL